VTVIESVELVTIASRHAPNQGAAPLDVVFSATVEGAEGEVLLEWDFGDDSPTEQGETVSHLYLRDGAFSPELVVWVDGEELKRLDLAVQVEPEPCPVHTDGVVSGTVELEDIFEASGLAVSRLNPGVVWTHNDAGDSARLFAMEANGAHRAEIHLVGFEMRDYEDIALGPGPDPGVDYLYVGDVGDNSESRTSVSVYRIPEPVLPTKAQVKPIVITDVTQLEMVYPGGALDSETLMIDPVTTDIWTVSKDASGLSEVHRYPAPHRPDEVVELEYVTTLDFLALGANNGNTTAGDIAPLGNQILVKTYSHAYVWLRRGGESLQTAFESAPCDVPLRSENQGESIAYVPDGTAYVTLSEGAAQPLWWFEKLN
jgi:hypothetical protein